MAKFVQVTAALSQSGTLVPYAVDDAGRVWMFDHAYERWLSLPPHPESVDAKIERRAALEQGAPLTADELVEVLRKVRRYADGPQPGTDDYLIHGMSLIEVDDALARADAAAKKGNG